MTSSNTFIKFQLMDNISICLLQRFTFLLDRFIQLMCHKWCKMGHMCSQLPNLRMANLNLMGTGFCIKISSHKCRMAWWTFKISKMSMQEDMVRILINSKMFKRNQINQLAAFISSKIQICKWDNNKCLSLNRFKQISHQSLQMCRC